MMRETLEITFVTRAFNCLSRWRDKDAPRNNFIPSAKRTNKCSATRVFHRKIHGRWDEELEKLLDSLPVPRNEAISIVIKKQTASLAVERGGGIAGSSFKIKNEQNNHNTLKSSRPRETSFTPWEQLPKLSTPPKLYVFSSFLPPSSFVANNRAKRKARNLST